jgi:hypothetical protein
MKPVNANKINRKSGEAEGPAVPLGGPILQRMKNNKNLG